MTTTLTIATSPAPAVSRPSAAARTESVAARIATDADRWRAVMDRDRQADGAFVYAVRSTGIYCRPSCPSRHPRRAVVDFHADPRAARAAGFRACKRCRPDGEITADIGRVRAICRRIEADPACPPSLADLAEEAGCSPRALQRTFKRMLGVSPAQYAAACRVSHFKTLVREGAPLADAAYAAGYDSSSRLYEQAGEALGMTPGAYRRGGAELDLRYAHGDGFLVAATARGFCALYLGDDPAHLVAERGAEFPAATRVEDAAALEPWRAIVARHLDGETALLELPLDIRATAFQTRVWRELRGIPRGETRTYGEIARAIGEPTAARAVGAACGRNPVSVVVPCHRAVGANGSLTGYRWGLAEKRRLLDIEGASTAPVVRRQAGA